MTSNKTIKNSLLITLGFIIITLFIWFRFLRLRMPRDLPLILLVLSFVLILFSTFIYAYIIFRLFKPHKKNKITYEIINMFFIPLGLFDNFYKNYINTAALFITFYEKMKNIYFVYILTNIIPRVITLIVLVIDVFVLSRFQVIYMILYITAIPLMMRYFLFSLEKIKDFWIEELKPKIDLVSTPYIIGVDPDEWPENKIIDDDDDDDVLPEMMRLPLDIFISYQTKCTLFNKEPVYYYALSSDKIIEQYKKEFNLIELKSEHYAQMRINSKKDIEKILHLALFIETYKQADILYPHLKYMKIVIYFCYFMVWSYILYLCLPKVLWLTGLSSLIHSLYIIEDPFSGNIFFFDLLEYVKTNQDCFITYIKITLMRQP